MHNTRTPTIQVSYALHPKQIPASRLIYWPIYRTYNNINTGVHTWSLTFTLSLDVLHDPCFLLSLALAPKQHNRLPNSPFCLLTACATVSKNQQDKYIPQLFYSSEIQSLQSHLHISCILLYLILGDPNN